MLLEGLPLHAAAHNAFPAQPARALMSSTISARTSTTSECPSLTARYRASAEAGIPRSSMSSTALKFPLSAVIAIGRPSLLGLTDYPVGRSPGAHAVGPWSHLLYLSWYRYCRIRNTKERCGKGDRMK